MSSKGIKINFTESMKDFDALGQQYIKDNNLQLKSIEKTCTSRSENFHIFGKLTIAVNVKKILKGRMIERILVDSLFLLIYNNIKDK